MEKRIIVVLAVLLVVLLGIGAVYNLTRNAEPETKRVLINYVIDGETEPFDSYYAEHAVGDQLRVVSPRIKGGYEPRIPIYTARVRSDMNVTVIYDFKAPDPALPESGILYQADFDTTGDWVTYFNSLDGLILEATGSNTEAADAKIVDNILHVADRGRILLKDDSGISETDSYTITFSMLFKSFEESSVATAFGFEFYDYDGGATLYPKVFRLDSAGKVYRGENTFISTLETDRWYTFTVHVDNIAMTREFFIDGVSFGEGEMYDFNLASGVGFRFFNTTSHTEYYLDNFVIYEGAPVKN